MFNDKYGLTAAVLERRKTQTRRIMKGKPFLPSDEIESAGVLGDEVKIIANGGESLITMRLPFRVGEVVAVAQSYCSIADELENCNNAKNVQKASEYISWMEHPGFNNKMFVNPELMSHQIRITGVRVERLQDISDEDCMKEGICYIDEIGRYYFERKDREESFYFGTPREAYASLIDKVSGHGTWEKNPYVFVYDFELVK